MFFYKNNQSGGDKQFVRNRIQKFTKCRNLIPPPCKVSIQNVCYGSGKENNDSQSVTAYSEPVFGDGRQKCNNKQRNDQNPAYGQVIRQVHTF